MRTTLTLADDVAARLEQRRAERGSTLREEVNDLLRIGLLHADAADDPSRPRFETPSVSVGRLLIGRLDDVAEALERSEGADHR